ncbi:MAG TPA: hypothetical protein VF498_13765 [Anaerolineales bacterium]
MFNALVLFVSMLFSSHLPRFERAQQGCLVDDPAARCANQAHATLHLPQGLPADQAARFGINRDMQADEIGTRVQLRQGNRPGPAPGDFLRRDQGIVPLDSHSQGCRPLGHCAANIAHTDHTQCFAVQFNPLQLIFDPLAGFHGCVGPRDKPRQSQH